MAKFEAKFRLRGGIEENCSHLPWPSNEPVLTTLAWRKLNILGRNLQETQIFRRGRKRDARRSRNIFESRSLESLKIERWIIKKDIEASHLERKKVTYLTTLDNSKLTTRNFFDRSSWFLANRGRFEDLFIRVSLFEGIFSLQEVTVFPNDSPRLKLQQFPFNGRKWYTFDRWKKVKGQWINLSLDHPPFLPTYLSIDFPLRATFPHLHCYFITAISWPLLNLPSISFCQILNSIAKFVLF